MFFTFIMSECYSQQLLKGIKDAFKKDNIQQEVPQTSNKVKIDSSKYFELKKQSLDECYNGKKKGYSSNDILHSCLRVLQFDSTDFEAIKIIGNLYFNNEQYIEAIKYYNNALIIKPSDTSVYMLSAISYGLLADKDENHYQEAIQYINAYLDKFSNDANVLIAKYNLLEKRDKEAASKFRIKACQLDPSYCNKSLLFVVDSLILYTEKQINNTFSINANSTFFDKSKEDIKKIFLYNTQYKLIKDEPNKLEYEDKKTTNEIFFLFENLKCRALRYSSIANEDKKNI
jgi:tetratricopeptide (TPR) repeat protein